MLQQHKTKNIKCPTTQLYSSFMLPGLTTSYVTVPTCMTQMDLYQSELMPWSLLKEAAEIIQNVAEKPDGF